MNNEIVNKITKPVEEWVKEDNKRGALVIVFEDTVVNGKTGIKSCELLFGYDNMMLAKALSTQADSQKSVLCSLVALKINDFLQHQLRKRRNTDA